LSRMRGAREWKGWVNLERASFTKEEKGREEFDVKKKGNGENISVYLLKAELVLERRESRIESKGEKTLLETS